MLGAMVNAWLPNHVLQQRWVKKTLNKLERKWPTNVLQSNWFLTRSWKFTLGRAQYLSRTLKDKWTNRQMLCHWACVPHHKKGQNTFQGAWCMIPHLQYHYSSGCVKLTNYIPYPLNPAKSELKLKKHKKEIGINLNK